MSFRMHIGGFTLLIALASRALAQDMSRDFRIKPEQLGLPTGTLRTSEPFVTRVYKVDSTKKLLNEQPQGYPCTITQNYVLKDDEDLRTHQGIDFSSRPTPGQKPTPLDFNAGVYGVVVKAGDGEWGTITIQVFDGTRIQYLHTMASSVKVGDLVAPDTKLGVTGRTGAGVIHLHIQAKDKDGNAMSPDLAFRLGQTKFQSKEKKEMKPDGKKKVAGNSGIRSWLVVKFDSSRTFEAGYKFDRIVADFDDLSDATGHASELNDARANELEAGRWFYLTRQRE